MKITENSKFKKLAAELKDYYVTYQKKSWKSAGHSLDNLTACFGEKKAKDIDSKEIKAYVRERQKTMANDSINLELRLLQRSFTVNQLPYPEVELLPINIRQDVFSHDEFLSLLNVKLPYHGKEKDLSPCYRLVISLAYYTGCRQNELLTLEWDQVNLKEGKLILKRENTKNNEGRTIYLQDDCLQLLKQQRTLTLEKYPDCQWVFSHKGSRLKSIKRQWEKALTITGLKGKKVFHGFRRTAITDFIDAGLSEKEAMEISGHKTRACFERYRILNEASQRKANEKLTDYYKNKSGIASSISNDIGLPIAI